MHIIFQKIHNWKYFNFVLNILGWSVFLIIPIIIFRFPKHSSNEIIYHLIVLIAVFYINMLWFIPGIYRKGK